MSGPIYGPFNRPTPWHHWWLLLWGVVCAVDLSLLVVRVLPWWGWVILAAITFGSMEATGLVKTADGYPPLTECVREYVPRWAAFAAIYFLSGLGAGDLFHFHHRFALAGLVGLVGWFTAHFDVTFDGPPNFPETVKYAWYAEKLGAHRASRRLLERKFGAQS